MILEQYKKVFIKNKNISLSEKVIEKGLRRANDLGLSFSAYLTTLINNDFEKNKSHSHSLNK